MSPPKTVVSCAIADPMYVELPGERQDCDLDAVILPLSLPPPTFLEKELFCPTPVHQEEDLGQIPLPPGLDVSFLDSDSPTASTDVGSGSIASEESTMTTTEQLNGECSPTMQKVKGKSAAKSAKSKKNKADPDTRWWTQSGKCLMCPLTNFPINLLPYPPFKLRVDPHRPNPHKLVDGKFLAMQVVATGSFVACGRELQETDMKALDDYCHRCRLGPFRPGKAMAVWSEVQKAKEHRISDARALKAMQELASYVKSSRAELGKLRRIQENRLLQMQEQLIRETSECVDGDASLFVD